ncbi:hypothetical protein SAMN02745244_02797 [Tessaracoccus bendigoensis DSM 12906]|uniref:DUF4337 domain-containing protein n=1 Tax=Tessaracoccus bendigoensis DSM 12906 TaxID=1123357 RepID=A0A1M6KEA0_9ACTN|nr:hypothetical protein [Tessaracoccus bendigoensis]SHJ57281.1 hypothetical protein SAMN02745244_02797 [Tessaracoccus bendigoensis DSM 12906]
MEAESTPERNLDFREHRWDLLAALILSLATLASAWCGFQASSWSKVYSSETRKANHERFEAARQSDIADRQLTSDLLIFTSWLQADVAGETAVAREIEERFLPHFETAFIAWRGLPAAGNAQLPEGSPFERPDYVLPTQAAADAATDRAEEALDAADAASGVTSRYVLTSMLFASVLFLAGIASKLTHKGISHAVVVVAAAVLAAALILLLTSQMML